MRKGSVESRNLASRVDCPRKISPNYVLTAKLVFPKRRKSRNSQSARVARVDDLKVSLKLKGHAYLGEKQTDMPVFIVSLMMSFGLPHLKNPASDARPTRSSNYCLLFAGLLPFQAAPEKKKKNVGVPSSSPPLRFLPVPLRFPLPLRQASPAPAPPAPS